MGRPSMGRQSMDWPAPLEPITFYFRLRMRDA
jgi:hypothetical protein